MPDPAGLVADQVWDAVWRMTVAQAAVDRLRRRAKPRHFQIFELYALRQWPALRVAQELGITRVQVYLVHHRVAKWVKEEVSRVELGGR